MKLVSDRGSVKHLDRVIDVDTLWEEIDIIQFIYIDK